MSKIEDRVNIEVDKYTHLEYNAGRDIIKMIDENPILSKEEKDRIKNALGNNK